MTMTDDPRAQGAIESAYEFYERVMGDASGDWQLEQIEKRDAQIAAQARAQALEQAALRLESESASVPVPGFMKDDPEKVIDATYRKSWLRACAHRIRALGAQERDRETGGEG